MPFRSTPAECGDGPGRPRPRRLGGGAAIALAALAVGLTLPVDASARSIPPGRGQADATPYIGRPAIANPFAMPAVAQNPFMAAGSASNIHNDSSMTDAYPQAGPIGGETSVTSVLAKGECASVTFTSTGQIVAICLLPGRPAYLTLMDPTTLRIITRTALPSVSTGERAARSAGPATRDYTELSGGYFYLDNRDRAVVATATRHVITYRISKSGKRTSFTPVSDVDLTGVVAEGDVIESALPDYAGNIWFVTVKNGVVGYIEHGTKVPRAMTLGAAAGDEQIANSFAMGRNGGVYIVSTEALYRFDVVTFPSPTWRVAYDNAGTQKPGQKSIGSGTTPTLMARNRVAIVDNAAPRENVVVYDTRTGAEVCRKPIFPSGRSATENSLIAIGSTLIAENNYGNVGPQSTTLGRTTTPGITRVDVSADGACRTVWQNRTISAPSVVPKASAATGLIYTYSKPKGPDTIDRWYWTALDLRTGKRVFSILVGTGAAYNNNYASLYLGPDGAGYVGVTGGLVRVSDTGSG